ncbi:MAG: hypothetical protein PHN45_03795 [Methylococcales bacterium]|nr:hypothetical protein [Methylococcales bacterium]MDD5753858.1 hypothetical protein [Methylococcales bacterium]
MSFTEIVSQVITEKVNALETRACPDQYVGEISKFKTLTDDFYIRDSITNRPNNIKCLILILESPHTEEFSSNPCPAKGKTGQRIREHIGKVIDLSKYKDYGLIILNAIPYQCSLGLPTKCFRDEIFKTVWSAYGKKDFIKRLKHTYKQGDVIVNCCTKGNSSHEELRKIVQAAIIKMNLECVTIKRTHPSSWWSDKNRKFIWK